MENIKLLVSQIKEGYEEEKPLYIKNNRRTMPTKESVFKIIDEAEFVEMKQSNVQEILREQHIVVTGMRYQEKSFEEALLEIAPLNRVTQIQCEHFGHSTNIRHDI